MKENFPDIGGRKIVAYFDFDPKTSDELEVKSPFPESAPREP